jgi:hypothetical protein
MRSEKTGKEKEDAKDEKEGSWKGIKYNVTGEQIPTIKENII